MTDVFSNLAGVLMVVGFIPYIITTLLKQTKPTKASWLIWLVLDTIALAEMYAEDTVNPQIIGAVIGVGIIAILSLKFGKPGWTWVEKWCLVGAGLGMALWYASGDPLLAIIISMIIVFLGGIPTFMFGWEKPHEEAKAMWIIHWVSGICAFIGMPAWTLEDSLQPITFFMHRLMHGLHPAVSRPQAET